MKFFPLLIFAVLLLFTLSACQQPALQHQLNGKTMGTTYHINLVGVPTTTDFATWQTDIDQLLADINAVMSTYQADSELSLLNKNANTDWIPISESLFTVLQTALRISAQTQGAFDVTVGPLVNLWGFGAEGQRERVPSVDAIKTAQARVGYDKVQLRAKPAALKKARGDVYIDLSALAKGYAVDRVAAWLTQRGVENYLVEIGGELRSRGRNAHGQVWRIAVEKPLVNQRRVQRIIHFSDMAMATSGDYRNYFERDGQRYSHIITPQTGKPITHRLASVSVLATSCMEADAWATALLVVGTEEALRLATQHDLVVFLLHKTEAGFEESYSKPLIPYLTP